MPVRGGGGESGMEFGISIPNFRGPTGPETFVQMAREAERLGFEALWVGDHVVLPERTVSVYPYARLDHAAAPREDGTVRAFREATGLTDVDPGDPLYEPLVVLSVLAGLTRRIRLGVGVLVVPYRQPVLAAKMLATLDVMSGGRLILGVGVGWLQEEFEALGGSYEHRGAMTDEYLTVMRLLWTEDRPVFDGRFCRVAPGTCFAPKPTQKPTMPIWVGGNSPAALRRAVRAGTGWFGVYQSAAECAAIRDRLGELLDADGRELTGFTLAFRTRFEVTGTRDGTEPCVGSRQKVVDDIRRYRDAGIDHLQLATPTGPTTAAIVDQMQRFAEEIRPALR
jgi:probable F420-dependent oxidoreductase